MKKTFLLLFVFSLITIGLNALMPHISAVAEVEPIFARIKYNNVYLYKTANLESNLNNVYFLLEESYFVKITSQVDDNFFKVNYMDLEGFVKQNEVECVSNTPSTPYLDNITFNTAQTSSVILRSQPSAALGDETALIVLAPNTQNLVYYGKIAGQEATTGLGNLWYYAAFKNEQNQTIKGYVYSPLTYNLTPIMPNAEGSTTASFEELKQVNTFLNISPNFRFIVIIIVVLPTFLILYLFFKPSKIED
jgi:hypothetical protein